MSNEPDELIILTTGKQDRGTRATLGFSWGCTVLAVGQGVTMFLTMDGTVWAMRGATKEVEVGGFEPLEDYLEQFLALGGELLVCAPCSEYYCAADRDLISTRVIQGAQLAGLATVVSRINGKTKTLTF